MGFLGGLVKAAVNIVTLPVAIVADVVTLGGAETTGETMENIGPTWKKPAMDLPAMTTSSNA